eukprot:2796562-Pleurochrysis_carterae.AAC.1
MTVFSAPHLAATRLGAALQLSAFASQYAHALRESSACALCAPFGAPTPGPCRCCVAGVGRLPAAAAGDRCHRRALPRVERPRRVRPRCAAAAARL